MKAIPFHLPNNPNMACSKIFPGDLPEITEEIMQYLRKDFSTLYSCILVNRLWCRLAIPLLWEDPFSAPTRNYHCIKTYSCFFSEDSKAKFNEYEINDNLLISNTLFNYPSFIKYLDIDKICDSIKYWGGTLGMPDYDNIYLFIENNQHNSINYLTFDVDYSDNYTLYNKLSSTVLQNLGQVLPSKLEYLCLSLIFMKSDLEIFLKNSQNTFIKKLLFRNIFIEDGNILFCIKKYIIKKERVKYLAILGVDDDVDELFSLKDEVNEFKLHNIIVQSYDDLYISEHDYISNHLQ
ncbi:uncharacterized protein OCT59_012736 [Rhizophagus irregularis]|uniref:uncharacterized protein n=1 Tax=Rhizophagus irregularis TaxID=588596 RepID=UPI003331439C|nr:hypothetical protein OCT59_012736 [Rhizophagus irregularis]